jgi:CheY-like chemotaxis protein
MPEVILAAVDDLIFLSKIQQTARLIGALVEAVDPTKLEQHATRAGVRGVILDLNHRSGSAMEALRALKANPATARVPVVGFVSHVQSDLIAAARDAGCDEVLARSAFTAQLPQLLRQLAGHLAADPSVP